MSRPVHPPFERTELLDKPGIVGAKWWQESLSTHDPVGRRTALLAIAVGGLAILPLGGLLAAVAARNDEPATTTTLFGALDMQRKYGWSFGAASEGLTFDGQTQQAFDRSALDRLVSDFAPAQARLKRFSSPTLFQSPSALPTSTAEGDPTPATPLREALRPMLTTAMSAAYQAGKSLAAIFAAAAQEAAIVVDLPGPQAIAFAAGLAGTFDPCFTFENWPHPRGVVHAHLTLAAAAYYQPLFARTLTLRRQPAPAALVLDRQRLAAYTDDASQFDNRYAAKLPAAAALKQLGVKHVLYVVPTGGASDQVELDDLNAQFVDYLSSGVDVKTVALTDFGPDPTLPPVPAPPGGAALDPPYFYGSSATTQDGFWNHYAWSAPPRTDHRVPANVSTGYDYVPRARQTAFSGGAAPTSFGLVPVVIAVGTGAVLGAKLSRSGSWNRASSGS